MNSHLSKTLCRSFRKMGEKTVPPVRYLLMPLVLLLVLVPCFPLQGLKFKELPSRLGRTFRRG
ncbi:hypothetical protein MASR2M17_25540 [Aminivibrio sp.]